MSDARLEAVDLDETTLPATTPEIENDRRVAIADLLSENRFAPADGPPGPYRLVLSLQDNRLVLDISTRAYSRTVALSLTPLKGVLKDYLRICDSYYEALSGTSPTQIEAVDMGRRGLHNEGADLLMARLAGKVEVDHPTARRLFTLVCALYRRT